MKKLGLLLFPLLAITLMLGGNAFASGVYEVDPSVYFVTYYSNAHTVGAPDATVRIINDGDLSTGTGECINFECGGNLWADIFVFDDSQELQECCSCEITADGLLSESVNQNLTANSLTGKVNTRGVIKVISDPSGISAGPDPAPGLRAWATHIQATSVVFAAGKAPAEKSPFYVTETNMADSNLNAAELERLDNLCSFAITLGSGSGVCSCNYEDYEF
ncbi:MAG: hypothetical protein ABR861_13215 [Terriglobales bacterium]|jgi:hypothetical protein